MSSMTVPLTTPREGFEEALGLTAYAGGEAIFFAAPIELFAGDLPAAEAHLLRGYELLNRAGARGTLSTAAGLLALLLAGTGRDAEAEEYASVCEAEAASDDVLSQVLLRCARALVSASREAAEQAERLAAQAVALAAGSDDLNLQGDALAAQAAVLGRLGRPGAARALERAAACYELKENAVMAARCREAPG